MIVKPVFIKTVFVIAALYDGVLSLAFLFFGSQLFERFQITQPNHYGYIHFPALLLLAFAVMFAQVAADPVRNRNLIPYGMGLKVAYAGTVFFHQLTGTVPAMWIPMAWMDIAFLFLFGFCWMSLSKGETES